MAFVRVFVWQLIPGSISLSDTAGTTDKCPNRTAQCRFLDGKGHPEPQVTGPLPSSTIIVLYSSRLANLVIEPTLYPWIGSLPIQPQFTSESHVEMSRISLPRNVIILCEKVYFCPCGSWFLTLRNE